MFVGHYGPSFVAKRLSSSIPLWILFLAVQLVDVFWAIFIFLGVERVRIVPGFTETNALDLYYMPYTHSLPGAAVWAAAAAILYRSIKGSWRDGVAKVGLGLWDYPYVTLFVEGALLLGAMGMYMAGSRPLTRSSRFAMPAFGLAILLMQTGMLFAPPPPSDRAMATTALVAYGLCAAVIAWLEGNRAARHGTPGV